MTGPGGEKRNGRDGPRVVVYTTERCGWCERAKALLEARGIEYREEWVPRTPEGRARIAEVAPGARSFPQIVVDGEPIGGYQSLVALVRVGGLEEHEG